MQTRPIKLAALVVTAFLVLTACNVQLEVTVDVEEDGSGTVVAGVGLDADAIGRFPPLGDLLVTGDLVAAGWSVSPPQILADGREWVQAEKGFDNNAELNAVLDEIFGASAGVFNDWEIIRAGDRATEEYLVTGDVDLTDGLDLFSDAALREIVDAPPLGTDVTEIEATLGQQIEDTVGMRVVVQLPPDSSRQVFETPFGQTTTIVAESSSENRVAQLLGWARTALIVLLILAIVLAIVNLLLDRRYAKKAPARRPETMAQRVPGAAPGAAPAAGAAGAASGPRGQMQMIVLDAHDALFELSADPHERIIPFIRHNNGTAPDEEIIELYRQATLGRLHAEAFWQAVGVEGDPQELDAELLAPVRLQQGAKEFLREMHRRGVPVAVITNDMAEWSYRLRDLHGLSGVAPWIVSSDIGVRKPDPAAFEALRRLTGVPYHSMLCIDGQIPSLDMAATLGMMTSWFAREAPPDDAQPGHAVVTRFADFFRRRRPPEPAKRGLRR
ncbi:MAG: HAD family hydrolase [Acidimicrobiales bacterium]